MLIGEHIVLRNLVFDDLDFLYNIENNEELWKYGSERKKISKKKLIDYISNSNIDISIANQFRFVIDLLNQPIGFIDLFNYKIHQVEVGIIIDQPFRRKGYAKEALNLISIYAFEVLKSDQLLCKINIKNQSSISLFSSCGFKLFTENKICKTFILRNYL